MKKSSRNLWVILFGIPMLLVLPVALIGSSVMQAGTIHVNVQEKHGGASIGAQLPAALIPVALHVMPAVVVDEVHCEMSAEVENGLEIARVAWRELSRCPDGIFVDVQTDCEIVTIEKREGAVEIYVDTPDETVRISVPVHTVSSVLSFLT